MKKIITVLTVLTLMGLFSLTQVVSASASQASKYPIPTIDATTYLREIKYFKKLLEQRFRDQGTKWTDAIDKLEKLEAEFIAKARFGEGVVWKEKYGSTDRDGNFYARELEDSLTKEQFEKFGKSKEEAAKLADEFLQKLVDHYENEYYEKLV
ncbi:hypothetical protein [Streptococcus halichoeri]|uniref:hypothetical protein n=1 Tax=Streptococcus halichoeri TaxID=254785 RepID=UPI00135A947B|nr:hypothetical protein [Streptococcus halichoeri]